VRGVTQSEDNEATPRIQIERCLLEYSRVSSQLAADRELLQRLDTKFRIAPGRVPALLEMLQATHGVLGAGDRLVARYATRYFDTPDLRFYRDHLRGRRPRFKVRLRHYLDRHLSFLEIKRKNKDDRTEKERFTRPFGHDVLSAEDMRAIAGCMPGNPGWLSLHALVDCERISLVALQERERITIDLGVCCGAPGGPGVLLPMALVEVKRARIDRRATSFTALRAAGAREMGFSKYVHAMRAIAVRAQVAS
jgi:hypothetical protein